MSYLCDIITIQIISLAAYFNRICSWSDLQKTRMLSTNPFRHLKWDVGCILIPFINLFYFSIISKLSEFSTEYISRREEFMGALPFTWLISISNGSSSCLFIRFAFIHKNAFMHSRYSDHIQTCYSG